MDYLQAAKEELDMGRNDTFAVRSIALSLIGILEHLQKGTIYTAEGQ